MIIPTMLHGKLHGYLNLSEEEKSSMEVFRKTWSGELVCCLTHLWLRGNLWHLAKVLQRTSQTILQNYRNYSNEPILQ